MAQALLPVRGAKCSVLRTAKSACATKTLSSGVFPQVLEPVILSTSEGPQPIHTLTSAVILSPRSLPAKNLTVRYLLGSLRPAQCLFVGEKCRLALVDSNRSVRVVGRHSLPSVTLKFSLILTESHGP